MKHIPLFALAIVLSLPVAAKPPSRTTQFPPRLPDEVLKARVAAKVAEVEKVVDEGPIKPKAESLRKIGIPEWYADAKLGIFIHWGVYSVPAFGSEWYPRKMYGKDDWQKIRSHHEKTWGPLSEFGYKDFIPMFKAGKFDPSAWASLFKEAGAKYVIPVAEHHDGYSLYDNSFTRWDSTEIGPMRDVIGELAAAIRAEGLKFGVSSHRAFNWAYYFRTKGADNTNPEFFDLYGPDHDFLYDTYEGDVFSRHKHSWPNQSAEFQNDWLARTAELADKYTPDVIWFDFGIGRHKDATVASNHHAPMNRKFAAYYYNQAAKSGREVAINYKWNAFGDGEAMLDIERGKLAGIRDQVWQTDTSVSYSSWGYTSNHRYKPVNVIIDDFVDIVSKNGVLLLNIGPKADGTIPEHEQRQLREIGKWLKTNGEGIYGSRPWKTYGEGPTENAAGAHQEHKLGNYTRDDIRFTTRDGMLYAWIMDWPGKSVMIKSLAKGNTHESRKIAAVSLLGGGELRFNQTRKGLVIGFPAASSGDHVHGLRISFRN
jgi:alpha-L-fucosidase